MIIIKKHQVKSSPLDAPMIDEMHIHGGLKYKKM